MPWAVPTLPTKCLACDAELQTPIVCQRCHSLHPAPAGVEHFGLFGLKRSYDLDPPELQRRFLALSREIHPDFFGGKSTQEQALAVRLSADLNEAYRVLMDPILRAEYLLELAGGASSATDKSLPEGFLAEMMTLREQVEEALAAGDHAAQEEHRRRASGERAEACERVTALARRLPDAVPDDIPQLRQALNSIKYYDNVLKLVT